MTFYWALLKIVDAMYKTYKFRGNQFVVSDNLFNVDFISFSKIFAILVMCEFLLMSSVIRTSNIINLLLLSKI